MIPLHPFCFISGVCSALALVDDDFTFESVVCKRASYGL